MEPADWLDDLERMLLWKGKMREILKSALRRWMWMLDGCEAEKLVNELEKTENDGGKNGKGEDGQDGLYGKKKVGDGATYHGDEEKRPGLQM